MKEDILEQLVDSYLLRYPRTFTKHNVKFKPSESQRSALPQDQRNKFTVNSDIDVLGIHLEKVSKHAVSAVSCKSWQGGFDVKMWWEHLSCPEKRERKIGTSQAWKKFRELVHPTWSKAFRDAIKRETGLTNFTYIIAVTKLKNMDFLEKFKNEPVFLDTLSANGKFDVKIEFLTLETMIKTVMSSATTTVESGELGRFIQLIKAAGFELTDTTGLKSK